MTAAILKVHPVTARAIKQVLADAGFKGILDDLLDASTPDFLCEYCHWVGDEPTKIVEITSNKSALNCPECGSYDLSSLRERDPKGVQVRL